MDNPCRHTLTTGSRAGLGVFWYRAARQEGDGERGIEKSGYV